jgi:branched-chain amino acid transport system substrate-binding protein
MMDRRRFLLTSLASALAAPRAAGAQPPIRIGATLAQTGRFADIGQIQLRAYQLCVKHTNDKGGVLGRRLELVVEDDRSEAATAVRLYDKLIARDKVVLRQNRIRPARGHPGYGREPGLTQGERSF